MRRNTLILQKLYLDLRITLKTIRQTFQITEMAYKTWTLSADVFI
jgi:hypothetical protein